MVGTTLDKNIKREEKKKREIQENITETRLTQQIDNSNPYHSIQPILPGQQAYPVQFEPLAHIRLSRSTYKVHRISTIHSKFPKVSKVSRTLLIRPG